MVKENSISREDERERKLEELLLEEEIKGESRVQKAIFLVTLFFCLVAIVSAFFTDPFYKSWTNFLIVFLFMIYSVSIRSFLKRRVYKPFIKYLTVFICVSLVSFLIASYGVINNYWNHAVNSVVLGIQFVIIGLSGIYHRQGTPVFAGITAAVQYSMIFGYAVFFGDTPFVVGPEQYKTATISSDQLIIICVSLILLGIVVSFITKQLPVLLRRSLDSEAEFDYLEKMNKTIEEAHRQKTSFFVNIAHESKTPLTLIQNYLSKYIAKKGSDEDLAVIQKNVGKLLRDMVNFMDVEKLEKGTLVYDHSRITSLSELLVTTVPLFKGLAGSKNIDFFAEIEDSVYIKADNSALDRIVNNLINNAIRYTPEGGSIWVSLTTEDNELCISVRDTGIGIAEDQLKHIFTPYYQLSHTKRNIQGIGMGLSIVKKIVDSLEGRINIKSKPGEGSCFRVFFNRIQCEPEEKLVMTKDEFVENAGLDFWDFDSPGETNFTVQKIGVRFGEVGRNSVLIVEDNIDLLRYISSVLGEKYIVHTAENGIAALELLASVEKPDLILSDIMMDGMDGRTFYLELMKNDIFRDIPFIFLTAKTSLEEEIAGLNQGAIDFIHKPFQSESLIAKVDSIIQNKNLKQALFEKDKFATLGMLVGGISHEIFNPLSGITGPLANLERIINRSELKDNEKAQKYLGKIDSNTQRIAELVNNLRKLYRQDSFEEENIAVKDIAQSVIDIFKSKTDQTVDFRLIIDNSFQVKGSSQALFQIVTNLVSNAVDAVSDSGGTIEIHGAESGGMKTLSVKDTGCGIPLEHQKDIFNAFFTQKEVGRGTGMGLFIVKDLILKMGWTIDVTSEVGTGTVFLITCGR